jgi:uncharacterized protein YlxW (UPF0749 family)
MNVTTEGRGRTNGQGNRRQAVGHGWASGPRPPVSGLFLVLCILVLLGGCDKKAVEQAQQETRDAKTEAQKIKLSLALAQKEIANIKTELNAVRQSRDELQDQINQAGKERDQAMELAQKAREAMTAQSSGQISATTALQKQVAELNALVAAQQKELDDLRKGAAAVPAPATAPPAQVPAADPNEGAQP